MCARTTHLCRLCACLPSKRLWFGWVHKTAGSRPRDLSSSLRSSCSYLQTSTERMKGERGHLNQQQLMCKCTFFSYSVVFRAYRKQTFHVVTPARTVKNSMYRLKIRVEVKVKKLPHLWFIYVYITGCYENNKNILLLENKQNSICMTIECVWEQYMTSCTL